MIIRQQFLRTMKHRPAMKRGVYRRRIVCLLGVRRHLRAGDKPLAQKYRLPIFDMGRVRLIAVIRRRHHVPVVRTVVRHARLTDRMHVRQARRSPRIRLRLPQRRQQDRDQQRNDRHHHQQLNQRKTFANFHLITFSMNHQTKNLCEPRRSHATAGHFVLFQNALFIHHAAFNGLAQQKEVP